MDWIVRPIRAVLFADQQAFLWMRKKLGLTEYGMASFWLISFSDAQSSAARSCERGSR